MNTVNTPTDSTQPLSSIHLPLLLCPGRRRHRPPPPVLLRASQIDRVAAEEIEWLYTSIETGRACDQARASIRGWLEVVSGFHRDVLAWRYDPTPWPESVRHVVQGGFSLVLGVECSRYRPNPRLTRAQLEWAVGRRLQNRVLRYGLPGLRPLARRAEWHFVQALRAYAAARGRVPPVVPGAGEVAPAIGTLQ